MAMDPSERDVHPKNSGERGYGHGNEITLTLSTDVAEEELPRGEWVQLVGDGTVSNNATVDGDTTTDLPFNAILKHSAAPGDEVTVHLSGVVRANDESGDAAVYDVVDSFDDGDVLVRLR